MNESMNRRGRLLLELTAALLLLTASCIVIREPAPSPVPDDDYYGGEPYDDDGEVYYADDYNDWGPYDHYFYDQLRPHGEWVRLPGYGLAWRPYVVSGWSPYSVGYWAWYGNDWTWVGYEPFGYIVYHYGHWGYVRGYGWLWFSGREWAPHRVQWFSSGGSVGWCPIPPRVSGQIGLEVDLSPRHYVWVSNRDFLDRDLSRHRQKRGSIWQSDSGFQRAPTSPDYDVVERWTGQRPNVVKRDRIERQTEKGNVEIWVPDRDTRENVKREGSRRTKPWVSSERPSSSDRKKSSSSDRKWRSNDDSGKKEKGSSDSGKQSSSGGTIRQADSDDDDSDDDSSDDDSGKSNSSKEDDSRKEKPDASSPWRSND